VPRLKDKFYVKASAAKSRTILIVGFFDQFGLSRNHAPSKIIRAVQKPEKSCQTRQATV
jgi:hypothetical protein